MSARRTLGGAALALALALPTVLGQASTARAQGSSQSEIDRAVALGREGRELYERGQFAEALERFRAAERIAHSPVLQLHVARCERNLGRLVAARAAYGSVVLEDIGPDAPPPFAAARADAERELAALEARIPRVRILLGDESAATRVTLDGVVVERTARAEPVPVDPGEHVVAWTEPGVMRAEKTFRAVEGAAPVTIELRGGEPAPASPPPPPMAERPAPAAGGGGTLVPGLLALGVGVVALGVGTATGLVAASETSDIESRCDGNRCLAADADQADDARTMATISTIGFIAGGVFVAGGVVLLVTLGDGSEPAAVVSVAPSPLGVRGKLTF